MKKSNGAINPNPRSVAKPRILHPLPPQWQMHHRIEMEEAVMRAAGILEMFNSHHVDTLRGGDITYNPPPIVAAIQITVSCAMSNLLEVWERYDEEVSRLQHLGRELTSTPDKQ